METNRSQANQRLERQGFVEGELSREIVGAFYDVYNALGPGFLESVYSRALEIALRERGLNVKREFPVSVSFRGQQVGVHRLDMFVERRVVVENKATHRLADANMRQLLSYVTAANVKIGILLHFGPHATFRRVLGARKRAKRKNDSINSRNS
ncbi:MAG TPA: GxxExxY protein [Gemmatimonadaceae bacterium]|nr:GxxExxY protein [Gemmatimonadaceae bacterium]